MGRARDISKVFSTNTALATDTEISAFNYLTQSSASTVYQTKATAGLAKIVPSSVAVGSGTGSADSLGTVTFSGASSVSLNDAFISGYKNYRLLFNTSTSSAVATITTRMRAAGTDNSGAIYAQMTTGLTDTAAASNRAQASATSWTLEGINTNAYFNTSLDIFNPKVATFTTATGGLIADNNTNYIGKSIGLLHQANTSYDGITFIMSSGTFGGTITVLGYN